MTDLRALLLNVLTDPDDDDPRAVYADCLEDGAAEHPEPEASRVRAAFIRTQVALARIPLPPPRVRCWFKGEKDGLLKFELPGQTWFSLVERLGLGEWRLAEFFSLDASGGQLVAYGYVHRSQTHPGLGPADQRTVEIEVRPVERPDWVAERARLEELEGKLYDAGGAVCWPEPLELVSPLEPSWLGKLLQKSWEQRLAGAGVARSGDAYQLSAAGKNKLGVGLSFVRGFVEAVRCDERTFVAEAPLWFSHQPIRRVELRGTTPWAAWHEGVPATGWGRGDATRFRSGLHLHPALYRELVGSGLDVVGSDFVGILRFGEAADAKCRKALERACRRYGRKHAAEWQQNVVHCKACAGAGCPSHRHAHGLRRHRCDGSGVISSTGLPLYAGDE